ncbi:hypothetical protein KI387_033052, partial [Taxus chinensis]
VDAKEGIIKFKVKSNDALKIPHISEILKNRGDAELNEFQNLYSVVQCRKKKGKMGGQSLQN